LFWPSELENKRSKTSRKRRSKNSQSSPTTWNAKCPIFLGNFTPKTSNYCLQNGALGFPTTQLIFRNALTFSSINSSASMPILDLGGLDGPEGWQWRGKPPWQVMGQVI